MNSWNFNELTQQDVLDYKSCQRQDGSIYGVQDKMECQQGKELKAEDLQKIAEKANKGDAKAKAQLAEVKKVEKEQKDKAREEKKKAKEAEKKKKEAEAGKKGKGKGKKGGGKGKKGGGKGKGKADAKGSKGGGAAKAADTKQAQQQRRKEAINRARETVSKLQKMLRNVADPKAKQQIQTAISDLLKSVVDATKADMGVTPPQTPQAGALKGKVQAQQKSESKNEKE